MTPEIRALFPITKQLVYLNHAAVSPLPTVSVNAINSQLLDVQHNGSTHFRKWIAVKESARSLLAGLLGCRNSQVAFMRNTSDGLSTIANGYNWRPGDNIVSFEHEFPSNIYPWKRISQIQGVELRLCKERDGRIDFEELVSLVDHRTRVIAISHVQYASGFRINLRKLGEVARAHGALLVVDVIQSLGVIPLDVEAELVDVAAGACHKWLLGPEGVGYLYLSDRARKLIEPTLVGWISVADHEAYENFEQPWNRDALAWESGTGPVSLLYGVAESLKLLSVVGPDAISAWLKTLTDTLCAGLKGRPYQIVSSRLPGEASQIVCIRHTEGKTAMELYAHLKQMGVMTAPRNDRLRIAPHLYNTVADVEAVLAALP